MYYLTPPISNLVPVIPITLFTKRHGITKMMIETVSKIMKKIIKKAKYQYFITPCHSMVLLIFQLQRLNPFPPLPFLKEGRSRYSFFCFSYIKDTSFFLLFMILLKRYMYTTCT